jgi:hypothetical protein
MSHTDDILTRSRKAAGVSLFGGIVMATSGLFQLLEGISAVRNDSVLVVAQKYAFEFNTTVWGWIHIVIGASALVVGIAIVASQSWAYFLGIFLAVLSLVMQFMFLVYNPVGALVIIAIDFAVIWALCTRLREDWTIP